MADIYFYKSITGQVYNFRDDRVDNISGILPATADPLMDGTAAVGTSIKYAREDHVHPADTNKVDKEAGKGLSTNDFTTAEKNKLAGIASGAEVNVQSDWNVSDSSSDAYIKNKPTIPTETSQLTNDSNFVSDANYVHTDNNFNTTLKNKLNGIASGAEVNVQSDWDQTDTAADDYIKNKPSLLALGETSTTAYRGDRGKTAYTHATDSSRLTTATASGLYKVASTAQGHIASLTAVTKADITGLGIPAQDTTYSAGSNITLTGTVFSLTKTNVTGALGYTPPQADTNDAVTQTATTTNSAYEVLFSGTADNTTRTEGARKNSNLKFNPSIGQLVARSSGNYAAYYADLTGISGIGAGENKNVFGVQYKNTSDSLTHTVYPIGILGNSSTTNAYNSGVRLGSTNGTTIVGAGESTTAFAAALGKYNDENLYLVADGDIILYKNVANDASSYVGAWTVGGFTATPTDGQVMIADGTKGGFKTSGYTIAKSVPSNAVFTDTTYSEATSSTYGLVKIGYTASGKNYPVQLSSGKMYVNVPWTDNNTTYSAGTGLTLSSTTFSVSQANASTIINLLSEGTANAQRDDYIVAQYAGGGTTTTTYHRRKLSNIFAALNSTDISNAGGIIKPPTGGAGISVSESTSGYVVKNDGVVSIKGSAESSFRTGQVTLSAANIGAKPTQTAVSDPAASGTSATFIATITQNANGVITPTKKTVRSATASQSGLMSAADKEKLDRMSGMVNYKNYDNGGQSTITMTNNVCMIFFERDAGRYGIYLCSYWTNTVIKIAGTQTSVTTDGNVKISKSANSSYIYLDNTTGSAVAVTIIGGYVSDYEVV